MQLHGGSKIIIYIYLFIYLLIFSSLNFHFISTKIQKVYKFGKPKKVCT